MSTWAVTDWREKYAGSGIYDASRRLQAGAYRLVNADEGGVWLVGKHGSVWYPTWQAAHDAAFDGTGALAKLEERVAQCR